MTTFNAAAHHTPTGTAKAPLYQARPGIFDEMTGLDGVVRPAWQPLVHWLETTPGELQAHDAQKIERLVFEHFFDPQRGQHSWRLDLAPLILDEQSWALIECAAIQRATLYNRLLADLYGPQSVFAEGLIPPNLIQTDWSFLRPVHNLMPSRGHLTFLALDFARDHAGNWRIIDVHTETPAGHGYALANRMVVSEVAGRLFRETNALRIGPFYQSLMEDFIARSGSEDPLIAVLTPGPQQSAFVGHAFLARYMGHKRVQGNDLRVVNNRVFLKTIDGLKRIDLLVRAIEGHRADPLELAPDGFDGPVGLVEACRQNPDLILNALGSAVVENRGLSQYLKSLAQRFLGEDLVIADTPRVWLGDANARQEVLNNLNDYAIYYAQEGTGSPGEAAPGRHAATMSPQDRSALETDIRFSGPELVAERPVGFATAPTWSPEGLSPQPFALRIFVSGINGTFSVMPGGIALSVDADNNVALTSMAARSHDVWVTSASRSGPTMSLKRIAAQGAAIQRQAQPLESRAADNLFWLGRYCERADAILRLVRQTLHRSAPDLFAQPMSPRPVRALTAILIEGDPSRNASAKAAAPGAAALMQAVKDVCTKPDTWQTLPKTFESIRNIAVACRDRLSEDSWRVLSGLTIEPLTCQLDKTDTLDLQGQDAPLDNALDIIETSEQLLDRLSAFAGMSHENMTRNRAWVFLDLGRRIERAHQLSRLLLALFGIDDEADLDGEDMIFALQIADSFITFRSRYRFAPELHLVIDLLIIDETNPRSLAYQLAQITEHIARLPKSADDAIRSPDQRLALDLLTKVRLADVNELSSEVDPEGRRTALRDLLLVLDKQLPRLSELLSRQYFSLADEQPQRLHLNVPR